MGKSLILQIEELAQGMVQAFEAANDGTAALEESANMPIIIDGSDTGNLTIEVLTMLRYGVLRVQGLVAAHDLTFPAEVDEITPVETNRVITVRNESSYALTAKTDGTGATVYIPAGATRELLIESEDVYSLAEGGVITGIPHTVGAYSFGTPASLDVMLRYNFVEKVEYPINFAGSRGSIGVNPTSTFAMDVKLNGSSIGTVSVSTGGVFTFTTAGGVVKPAAVGDILTIVAPASVDATAAQISFTLLAGRK